MVLVNGLIINCELSLEGIPGYFFLIKRPRGVWVNNSGVNAVAVDSGEEETEPS